MTSMALDFFGGNRGRRKQAKPQRKNVDGDDSEAKDSISESDVESLKMADANPSSNRNRIVRLSDKRNIERNKGSSGDDEDEEDEDEDEEEGEEEEEGSKVLNDRGGLPAHQVPNESQLVRRPDEESRNPETVPKVNGVLQKNKTSVIDDTCKRKTNLGLQQLLLNGDCSPSLKEPKTPSIGVKTVNDLNGSAFKVRSDKGKDEKEEEKKKIQEYLKRSDTAVIYQEPVEQTDVPLSPAAVKALAEADINSQDHFIKCLHCQKAYPGLQALRDHIESEHPRNLSPNEALSPVQSSYSPVPVQGGLHHCAQCSVTFSTKDQLEKHELLHSPNAQVSCKVCNKQFANVYRLQRHMISHDESAVLRKFKCPECEKAFKFKHHLKEHIRIHSGEKPFECANCGKRFSHSGSYSSHMTSKKCLVMNLKVNRGRGSVGMDKTQMNRSIGGGTPKRNINNNNNINGLKGNLNLGPNSLNMANAPFPSILPKYSDTAAAFLSAVAPRSTFASAPAAGFHPFYMATPPTMHAYNLPALNHFLEHFATPSGMLSRKERDDYKEQKEEQTKEAVLKEESESKRATDEVKIETVKEEKSDEEKETKEGTSPSSNSGGDLEAVKRILETVNATVTKQFLQANMQKFTSSPSGSSCASASSPAPEEKTKEEIECKHCGKLFQSRIDHHQHERYICENIQKSEGLAAKLEEVANVKREGSVCSGSEDEDAKECEEEIERNEDGGITITTTTQEGGADGRKVRVRSLIADEQLAILKHHYLINPRPKREELGKIAEKIGFPVRVVQVWFQNTRARDRREGRLVQVPYLPLPTLFPNNVPLLHSNLSEQPLDLSTKKSQSSSPGSSPQRSSNDSDVINLSRKSVSPGSPQIFPNGLTIRAMPNLQQFQHSSGALADFRRTPSPLAYLNLHQEDLKNNGSRLARILTQPLSLGHRLDANGVTLVPMDRIVFNQDLRNSGSPTSMGGLRSDGRIVLSPENGRACSSSPGSDKRSWLQGDLTDETEDSRPRDLDEYLPRVKKSKICQDPQSDQELEGQFICDQCEKAFSKQSSLARHKYEHSGQRPHKCDVCDKAFKHKHHLTEHKRLHSGEKPFQCGKCLKRFSHSGSYSQHMNHRYSYCKPYRD